jgi:hypothetical protein
MDDDVYVFVRVVCSREDPRMDRSDGLIEGVVTDEQLHHAPLQHPTVDDVCTCVRVVRSREGRPKDGWIGWIEGVVTEEKLHHAEKLQHEGCTTPRRMDRNELTDVGNHGNIAAVKKEKMGKI